MMAKRPGEQATTEGLNDQLRQISSMATAWLSSRTLSPDDEAHRNVRQTYSDEVACTHVPVSCPSSPPAFSDPMAISDYASDVAYVSCPQKQPARRRSVLNFIMDGIGPNRTATKASAHDKGIASDDIASRKKRRSVVDLLINTMAHGRNIQPPSESAGQSRKASVRKKSIVEHMVTLVMGEAKGSRPQAVDAAELGGAGLPPQPLSQGTSHRADGETSQISKSKSRKTRKPVSLSQYQEQEELRQKRIANLKKARENAPKVQRAPEKKEEPLIETVESIELRIASLIARAEAKEAESADCYKTLERQLGKAILNKIGPDGDVMDFFRAWDRNGNGKEQLRNTPAQDLVTLLLSLAVNVPLSPHSVLKYVLRCDLQD